jgi:hypothetical protein
MRLTFGRVTAVALMKSEYENRAMPRTSRGGSPRNVKVE